MCRGDEPWQKALEKPCLVNFHGFIRQLQETEAAEKETEEFLCQVLKSEPLLITMDEVGCGIVPLKRKNGITERLWDGQDRSWRQQPGRSGEFSVVFLSESRNKKWR